MMQARGGNQSQVFSFYPSRSETQLKLIFPLLWRQQCWFTLRDSQVSARRRVLSRSAVAEVTANFTPGEGQTYFQVFISWLQVTQTSAEGFLIAAYATCPGFIPLVSFSFRKLILDLKLYTLMTKTGPDTEYISGLSHP